jgi:hypothetical protein
VTDDLDLEWSAVDGPDGCCWRLRSRGLCVVAKTKAQALAMLVAGEEAWAEYDRRRSPGRANRRRRDQLEGLLRSSHQPEPTPSAIQRGPQLCQE